MPLGSDPLLVKAKAINTSGIVAVLEGHKVALFFTVEHFPEPCHHVIEVLAQVYANLRREFRDCSYGFRPGRNAHQALKRLGEIIMLDRTQWLVEADIKGFFQNGVSVTFPRHRR